MRVSFYISHKAYRWLWQGTCIKAAWGGKIRRKKGGKTKIRAISISLRKRARARLNIPTRASLYYTVFSCICRGVAFLTTPIFTRIMTEGQLGEYSLFITYLNVMTTVGSLELGTGVLFSLLSGAGKNERALTRSALICMLTASTLAVLPASVLYYTQGSENRFIYFAPALLCATLARVTVMLFSGVSRYRYKYRAAGVIMLTEAILPPALTLAVFKLSQGVNLARVRIFTLIFALTLCAVPLALHFLILKGQRGDGIMKHARGILKTALPTLPYFLFISIFSNGDKIIIARLLGNDTLARYGVAFSLGTAITMLCTGISAIMTPWTMRKWRACEHERAQSCIKVLMRLIALLTLIFACVTPELFALLAPAEYKSALPCVYPIALGCLPLFLSGLTAGCILSGKGRITLVLPALFTAVLSLSLNALLLPSVGILSSGVIYFISCVSLLLLMTLSVKQKGGKTPVSVKNYLQTALVSSAFVFITYLLRDAFIPRIIIIIPLIAILIRTACRARNLIKEA